MRSLPAAHITLCKIPITTPCCPSSDKQTAKECCCPVTAKTQEKSRRLDAYWIEGVVHTAVGEVPQVSTTLCFADRLGAWKARWGIGRMHYRVEAGLYAVGSPTSKSPVLVSANYKMSFDRLRSQLSGHDAWILVLDTRGINVWCAAGAGTFGTNEIVRRTQTVRLREVISHRRLVLPQLSAPGVNMHEVKRQSGFQVVYGPARAEDLPAFLAAGMKATPEMRCVQFPLRDRVVLIPVEIVLSAKYALYIAACFLVLAGLSGTGYSPARIETDGLWSAMLFLGAYLAGVVLAPPLLPWLPGRSFSLKGTWIGLVFALGIGGWAGAHPGLFANRLSMAAWFLIAPAVASFMAMIFTGASSYTSLSGVRLEMRVAVPIQIIGTALGLSLWLVGRFV